MLGVSTYAVREGAKLRENKKEFQKFTSQVFTINILSTIASYIVLAALVFTIPNFTSYKVLFLILSMNIGLTTLSVDWLNTIFEDFLYITIRSIVINIISLLALFAFVKTKEDYIIYAGLQVLTHGLICVSNWFYCRKYVRLRIEINPDFKKHLPKLIILFANALAVSIYVNFDTTMLGLIKGDYYVGLYTAPTRIYLVVKSLMIAIYTVTIPRLSSLFGANDKIGFKTLYSNLWCTLSLVLIPAGVGLACVSEHIILLFGGSSYLGSSTTLQILSFALIFSIFGGLITACLNVTIGREKENLVATILSALLNCILNIFFIPLMAHNGAAITTVLAELFVVVYCYLRIPDREQYIEQKKIMRAIVHALIGSATIILTKIAISLFGINIWMELTSTIIGSAIVYSITLIMLKDETVIKHCGSFIRRNRR